MIMNAGNQRSQNKKRVASSFLIQSIVIFGANMELVYPRGEIVWVRHCRNDDLQYIITSKETRDYYYIYELKDGKFVKLGKDRNPTFLEEKYINTP